MSYKGLTFVCYLNNGSVESFFQTLFYSYHRYYMPTTVDI